MIKAIAPAKVNLLFQVGPLETSGYHQVNSLYLELDLCEEVSIAKGKPGTGVSITVTGADLPARHLNAVPKDRSNLVYQVAEYFFAKNTIELSDLEILIHKSIPVAGGMAGGSADAAAMMVAVNEFLAIEHGVARLSKPDLVSLAAQFGSDVPFSLLGGLALGTGRGEQLTAWPALPFDAYFVLLISQEGLSTPQVFAKFDELGGGTEFHQVRMPESVDELASMMANDLQDAAITLLPSIQNNISRLEQVGALTAMVSGSGPTVLGLFSDAASATKAKRILSAEGLLAFSAQASYSTAARHPLEVFGPGSNPGGAALSKHLGGSMSEQHLAVVVLAAGEGTRMRSATPKVMHEIAGLPMLAHALATASSINASCNSISDVISAISPYALLQYFTFRFSSRIHIGNGAKLSIESTHFN
ncbi:MAG: 4-(cytidine 5'-diphospho)-2-C-methyl-D-erythritol kinase [Micrococcales bacterium]|nr:4-(cytidine 5'-diphospho)-2-C-methyl-D-erythritol kinase [Micrococcales bacterium]